MGHAGNRRTCRTSHPAPQCPMLNRFPPHCLNNPPRLIRLSQRRPPESSSAISSFPARLHEFVPGSRGIPLQAGKGCSPRGRMWGWIRTTGQCVTPEAGLIGSIAMSGWPGLRSTIIAPLAGSGLDIRSLTFRFTPVMCWANLLLIVCTASSLSAENKAITWSRSASIPAAK
jgi:hypothetical protein